MDITAESVRDLREKTGAGMMDCKKALVVAEGDFEKALEVLRKQGLAAASKKAGRIASEGIIVVALNSDSRASVMLELNCETDFVAKNEDFKKFGDDVAQLILQKNPSTLEEMSGFNLGAETVTERINLLVAKIGEKISLRRFVRTDAAASEKLGSYIHLGSKIGVVVRIGGQNIPDGLLKEVAMHVAASHPLYLKRQEIPETTLAKEREIYLEQMKTSGKPANILEKIIEGKISKFASDICLADQIFIKDPTGKKTITQVLKEVDPSLQVVSFQRYQVGEGIEKKKEDFAAEVAKMMK